MGDKGLSFQKIKVDLRKYQMISRDYSFAGRLFFGTSTGKNPQKFYLGGGNSIWYGGRDYDPLEYYADTDINQLYFSQYVSPIRGASFLNRNGYNVSLFNFEVRAPFLLYYFPAIKWLGQINAIAFIDIGGTWNDDEWDITKSKNWRKMEKI